MKKEIFAKKLREKLIKELDLHVPVGAKITRIYAGRHQLAMGSWKWAFDPPGNIGSIWTATEVLNAKILSFDKNRHDFDIYVEK